jgi:hypothetical protein
VGVADCAAETDRLELKVKMIRCRIKLALIIDLICIVFNGAKPNL